MAKTQISTRSRISREEAERKKIFDKLNLNKKYEDIKTLFGLIDSNGLFDGDKGEITVSALGQTWTINNGVITDAKITSVSATKVTQDVNHKFVTDANLTVINNTSGTNTGDNATNTTSNAYADGKVADAINDGVTTVAPSQNAVFDALALKYDASNPNGYETPSQLNTRDTNNRARANHTGTQTSSTISDFASTVLATVLSGLSVATAQVIASTDTILQAFGYLQAQITLRELLSNKSDSYTLSSSTTYASTKALVDGLATKQATLTGSIGVTFKVTVINPVASLTIIFASPPPFSVLKSLQLPESKYQT